MIIEKTEISDVLLIKPRVFADNRGFFLETWNKRKFTEAGLDFEFVQDNHSGSVQGTLRGLHYQVENSQGKLIRVTSGKVFDVAVDLRRNSPTLGKWVGKILSSSEREFLWIPPGFAHGFLVLSEYAEFEYKCTDFYNPAAERCIIWNDQDLKIEWPLQALQQPVLSEKDRNGVAFSDAELF